MSEAKDIDEVVWVPLDSLRAGENGISFIGRLISLRQGRDRRGREYSYGFVGDGSTSVPYVAWRPFPFKVGDVVEVKGARVEEWDDELRLAIPTGAEVRRTEKVEMAYPKIPEEENKLKISEIKEGIKDVKIEAVVLDVERHDVNVRGRRKEILKGIVADETAKVHFTSWKVIDLTLGSTYRFDGVYVKSWGGRLEIVIDESTVVEELPPEGRIKLPRSYERSIASIKSGGGGLDVEVSGFISYVSPRSGFILSCPECERPLKDGRCSIHGEVKGFYNLKVWVHVTDNTSTLEVLLPRIVAQKLLNIDVPELLRMHIEPDYNGREEVLRVLRRRLSSLPVKVVGDVIHREKRPALMVAKSAQPLNWAEVSDVMNTLDKYFGGNEVE